MHKTAKVLMCIKKIKPLLTCILQSDFNFCVIWNDFGVEGVLIVMKHKLLQLVRSVTHDRQVFPVKKFSYPNGWIKNFNEFTSNELNGERRLAATACAHYCDCHICHFFLYALCLVWKQNFCFIVWKPAKFSWKCMIEFLLTFTSPLGWNWLHSLAAELTQLSWPSNLCWNPMKYQSCEIPSYNIS